MQNEKDPTRDGSRSPNFEKLKEYIRKILTKPQTKSRKPDRSSRVEVAVALSF
jgi:hypothetical protein